VWKILKANGIEPAPRRTSVTWSEFLHSQAAVACDFVTIDTATMRRYYLLVFIDIRTRAVLFGGITTNPTGAWTTQAARNLSMRHRDLFVGAGALVRDRGSQFVDAFDEVFRSHNIKILKCPVRTPVANAYAERWIGTLRRELLDRTIIWNQRQLERLVVDYIDHYNTHRPVGAGNAVLAVLPGVSWASHGGAVPLDRTTQQCQQDHVRWDLESGKRRRF
jgi:transposase InsO family protein